jgi:hypothetical protein
MRSIERMNRVALIVLLFIVGLSCARKELTFDTRFSINLARPGKDFRPEKPTLAQEEVLEKYGLPDFVRIYWDRKGEIVTLLAVDQALREGKYRELKQTWIYLSSMQEISFPDDEHHEVAPLSEKMKIVCEFGDPDQMQKQSDSRGGIEETWTYYGKGWIFRFYNDTLMSKQQFQAMGSFIKK